MIIEIVSLPSCGWVALFEMSSLFRSSTVVVNRLVDVRILLGDREDVSSEARVP